MNNQSNIIIFISGISNLSYFEKYAEQRVSEGTGASLNILFLKNEHSNEEKEFEAIQNILQTCGGNVEIIDVSKALQLLGGGETFVIPNSNNSYFPFPDAIKYQLLINGFIVEENKSYIYFGKLENVYSQKIYFKNNSNKYRAMHIGGPTTFYESVNSTKSHGWITGFKIGGSEGGGLEQFDLDKVNFVEA